MNEQQAVTAVLGDSPSVRGNIIIDSADGVSTTNSFVPTSIESALSQNPKPVSGYADSFRSDKDLSPKLLSLASLDDAGRFRHQPEVIIGPDDRERVSNPQVWPYCVHGHMIMRFPNGKVYIGTGTMVNRHHVITAGHCVFSKEDGGWATSVQFNAAQNDASLPFGSASATRLLSVKGWTDGGDRAYDFGMLVLGSEVGQNTGWYGLITVGNDSQLHSKRVNVSGYPGDKGGQQMWAHADVIKSVAAENFYYDIDTMGGQSGSGVWSLFDGFQGEKVAGVHTTGAASGNGATRISRWKFDLIVNWFQQY